MIGLLIALLVIIGIAITAAILVTLVSYAIFLSQAIQVANWGPDWLNGGGIITGLFAFAAIIVGIAVVGLICRIAYGLLYSLLALPIVGVLAMRRDDIAMQTSGVGALLVILAILMALAWLGVSICLTHGLLTYTESMGYVDLLNPHSVVAWIGTLVTINGLVVTQSSNND